jgi:molybdenum cofactor guanylyltransferase
MAQQAVTGLILAGGRGVRMGGIDKGLQLFRGKPLVAHVVERLTPQVGALLISANRNADAYAHFGWPVIGDLTADFAGPLAGIQAGLAAVQTPFLVTAPCDSPRLPVDLVERLIAALEAGTDMLAVPSAGARRHPAFMLCRRDARDSLDRYLAEGGRKVQDWCALAGTVDVAFDDQPDAFANINTLEELDALTKGWPAP